MTRFRLLTLIVAAIAALQVFSYDVAIKTDENILPYYDCKFEGPYLYLNILSEKDGVRYCEVTYKSVDVIDGDTIYNVGNEDYVKQYSMADDFFYEGLKYKVIKIGEHAFQDCKELTEVFCGFYRTIGKEAFKNCENFKGITSRLQSYDVIGESAFENCKSLKEFEILEGYISSNAFKGCNIERFLAWGYVRDRYGYENTNSSNVFAEEDAFGDDGLAANSYLIIIDEITDFYSVTAPWKYFSAVYTTGGVTITGGGGSSSIPSVTTSPFGDSRIYTIDGRAVNAQALDHLPKGIYICGGKKIIK